jgi:hypothetical protein
MSARAPGSDLRARAAGRTAVAWESLEAAHEPAAALAGRVPRRFPGRSMGLVTPAAGRECDRRHSPAVPGLLA